MLRNAAALTLVLLTLLAGSSLRAQTPASSHGATAFLKLLDTQPRNTADELPLPDGAYRVADGISAPQIIVQSAPDYSNQALQAGLEGDAFVAAVIGEDGSVSNLRIARSLGFGLDEKAMEAVSKWKFKPGEYKGIPVSTFISFAVDFRIPHDPARWHLLGIRLKSDQADAPPVLKTTVFPHGAGISNDAMDEGQMVVATGRLAIVTLFFDVDRSGVPTDFHAETVTDPLWGKEAIAVVRAWRFKPALKDGKPVPGSGQIDLVWGPRELPRPQVVPESGLISTFDQHPPVVERVEPLYSFEALTHKIQGTVMVSMRVDEEGVPHDLKPEWKLGYGLDEKAVDAVSRWRFRPIVSRGKAVAVPAMVAIHFTMPPAYGNVVKPKERTFTPIVTLP
ncbi:MAG TPA: TonB family protein [Bryobacteraceae bacterium]|jgi:TonB family protein|nr:TonB family protein [Bryobacteraceae bacterium]